MFSGEWRLLPSPTDVSKLRVKTKGVIKMKTKADICIESY